MNRSAIFLQRLLKEDGVRGILCVGASAGLGVLVGPLQSSTWWFIGAVTSLLLAIAGALFLLRWRIRIYRR